MERFERTSTWSRTLGRQGAGDVDVVDRERLHAAFMSFRGRAATVAGEIARDLPDFTVHDVSHLDALWEMADLLVEKDFPLTPTEAFVLGGAFLVHDLGMGLAAYPDGVAELSTSPLWADIVVSLFRSSGIVDPSRSQIVAPPSEIRLEATRQLLRELHAQHAERLALISWKEDATQYFLIEDPVLRNTYGPIIGRIAHSHWWPIDRLASHLPKTLGSPGGLNNSWTVDPVKVACILRSADASHIDERRAPAFLRALRKPVGVSGEHWNFQEKLYQPRLAADRLIYTAKSSFPVSQASSWWVCFDTIQMIDRELRSVDALLADSGRPRLAARGVSHSEDPSRLSELIGANGWVPMDTRIRVGNVARLVSSLGGKSLYGDNLLAPLRELIQNAADAVRARRILEELPDDWGTVTVSYGTDDAGAWIEVADSGVGMSMTVLTGPFLDFGSSLWGTPLMHRELPGLEAKGFKPTGQFGIGFFSVFMWGRKAKITTRRFEKARDETLVLTFDDGVGSRPILSDPSKGEMLADGGTTVKIWFEQADTLRKIEDQDEEGNWTLANRCAWLCPALDVNLFVRHKTLERVVAASDWLTLPGEELLERIEGPFRKRDGGRPRVDLKRTARNLRVLQDDAGRVLEVIRK